MSLIPNLKVRENKKFEFQAFDLQRFESVIFTCSFSQSTLVQLPSSLSYSHQLHNSIGASRSSRSPQRVYAIPLTKPARARVNPASRGRLPRRVGSNGDRLRVGPDPRLLIVLPWSCRLSDLLHLKRARCKLTIDPSRARH